MQIRYVFTRPDGGVSIIHGMPKSDIEKILGELTDEEYEAHVYERSIPANAINVIKIALEDVPASREFRDAWTHDGKNFGHDLEKARAIQLERIRVARAPKLAALDIDYQKADEAGDVDLKKTIASQKQHLRDITSTLKTKTLTSIEDVKDELPEELLA